MELKRTILAVVLSMAVLLIFQKFIAPSPPQRVPTAETPSALGGGEAPAPAPAPPASQILAPSPAPSQQPIATVTLENDLLAVTLSNRAASIVGARLKKYGDRPGGDPVELLSAPSGYDLAGATRLVTAAPQWSTAYREVQRSGQQVAYAWESADGVRIEKTYTLEPGRYDLSLEVRVVNGSGQPLRDRLGLILVQDFTGGEDRYTFTGPAYYRAGELEEVKLKKVKEGVQDTGEIDWAAFLEKYFLVAALPGQAKGTGLRIGSHLGLENVVELELDAPFFDLAPGADMTQPYRLYLGPKLSEALAPLGSNFSELVNYGFFDLIAKPLAVFLKMIYRFVGNYGIAIIILTALIKGVFWPLSARSFKSMQRMKELQPKMQRLKEKYGNDRERLNMEVMQLYKTHKVNPLGGCLPMLVQIPFFFALYKILLSSIELRHAPFMLWIQDLSAKDPYYITPLLMGASMFLQQKMTPAAGPSEGQMKMMMYGMPVVFTFLFLNFPSGLVIYWLVNNLLSIAQQAMMIRGGKAQASA